MKPTQFIDNYFNVEKLGGLLISLIGITAFFGASYFLFFAAAPDLFYKGMAWPLLIVAFVQVGVGVFIYWRSPRDIKRVETYFHTQPDKLITDELPRIKKVFKDFVFYVRIQVTLCVVGVFMIIFTHSTSDLLMGIGVGLLVQGGIMLMFDYLAERRAGEYCRSLEQAIEQL